MANGYVKPSDYGPAFIFELLSGNLTNDRFYNIYQESFAPYNLGYMMDSPEKRYLYMNHIIGSFNRNGVTVATLNKGIFDYQEFQEMHVEIEKIPFESANHFRQQFYRFVPNENVYDYILVSINRDNPPQKYLSTPERRTALHNILKIWSRQLEPNFVWGDWFATLKKEGENDSRLNIWAYNYYSKRLAEAIGMDRFQRLVETTKKWNLEEFNDGIILTGHPDPYSTTKKTREKAKEILRLEERLAGIIQKKAPIVSVQRDPPPKGVIE